MKNRAWASMTAGLIGLLAACTSTSPTPTPLGTAVTASTPVLIPHSTDPGAVVLQVGDYHLGWGPDVAVSGPEIVLYGDGRLYAELFDGVLNGHATWTRVSGALSEPQVQALLEPGENMPADPPMDTIAVDTFPTVIVSAARRWEVNDPEKEPFRSFLTDLRSMVRRDAVDAWVPERWVVRIYPSPTCAVTDAPAREPSYDAPVYPSLLDQLPLGPVDCYPAPAVEATTTTSSGPATAPGAAQATCPVPPVRKHPSAVTARSSTGMSSASTVPT